MEPKDMTNEKLYQAVEDGVIATVNPFGNGMDILSEPRAELLRRLNEADALRKENKELKNKLKDTFNPPKYSVWLDDDDEPCIVETPKENEASHEH